jgi:hypothetical protein
MYVVVYEAMRLCTAFGDGLGDLPLDSQCMDIRYAIEIEYKNVHCLHRPVIPLHRPAGGHFRVTVDRGQTLPQKTIRQKTKPSSQTVTYARICAVCVVIGNQADKGLGIYKRNGGNKTFCVPKQGGGAVIARKKAAGGQCECGCAGGPPQAAPYPGRV